MTTAAAFARADVPDEAAALGTMSVKTQGGSAVSLKAGSMHRQEVEYLVVISWRGDLIRASQPSGILWTASRDHRGNSESKLQLTALDVHPLRSDAPHIVVPSEAPRRALPSQRAVPRWQKDIMQTQKKSQEKILQKYKKWV